MSLAKLLEGVIEGVNEKNADELIKPRIKKAAEDAKCTEQEFIHGCGCDLLQEALNAKNTAAFWALLKIDGIDINATISRGSTLLGLAVAEKNQEMVKLLIRAGANVNQKVLDGNGNSVTPLYAAVTDKSDKSNNFDNNVEMAALLLKAKAKMLTAESKEVHGSEWSSVYARANIRLLPVGRQSLLQMAPGMRPTIAPSTSPNQQGGENKQTDTTSKTPSPQPGSTGPKFRQG